MFHIFTKIFLVSYFKHGNFCCSKTPCRHFGHQEGLCMVTMCNHDANKKKHFITKEAMRILDSTIKICILVKNFYLPVNQ